ARLCQQMERVLLSLAAQERVSLAILSGRERADLQARVGIPGLIYAGNHGLEISGPGFLFVEPMASSCQPELQALAEDLASPLQSIPGAGVEDRGLTLCVHDRGLDADQREAVRQAVHAALSQAHHPFVVTAGERDYEIRPRVYWDKGTA